MCARARMCVWWIAELYKCSITIALLRVVIVHDCLTSVLWQVRGQRNPILMHVEFEILICLIVSCGLCSILLISISLIPVNFLVIDFFALFWTGRPNQNPNSAALKLHSGWSWTVDVGGCLVGPWWSVRGVWSMVVGLVVGPQWSVCCSWSKVVTGQWSVHNGRSSHGPLDCHGPAYWYRFPGIIQHELLVCLYLCGCNSLTLCDRKPFLSCYGKRVSDRFSQLLRQEGLWLVSHLMRRYINL